jgi:hypothetical protein
VTIRGTGTISRKDFPEEFVAQRTPPEIGWYLSGFADGEGSFNCSFRPRPDYPTGWKVSLCFNISQKERVILAMYKRHLGCGTLRSRPDGVWYYEVNNFTAIWESVIPFFRRYHFLSAKKKRDFARFRRIAELVKAGEHLSDEGIRKILAIRAKMNNGGKRTYRDHEILGKRKESPETIRRTSPREDDIVRSSGKPEANTHERS